MQSDYPTWSPRRYIYLCETLGYPGRRAEQLRRAVNYQLSTINYQLPSPLPFSVLSLPFVVNLRRAVNYQLSTINCPSPLPFFVLSVLSVSFVVNPFLP